MIKTIILIIKSIYLKKTMNVIRCEQEPLLTISYTGISYLQHFVNDSITFPQCWPGDLLDGMSKLLVVFSDHHKSVDHFIVLQVEYNIPICI